MLRSARAALIAVLLAAACNDGPTAPPPYHKPQFYPLEVSCDTVPQLRCVAFRFDVGDLTNRVSWSGADSFRLATDAILTPSATIDFPTPGVPRILKPGGVFIRADFMPGTPQFKKAVAPIQYVVAPGEPAMPASYLSISTSVGGATVEIVEGEGAGRTWVTREDNPFLIADFFRLQRPFTIRASKAGYEPDVQHHPGIILNAGYPQNHSVRLVLRKLE